MTPRQFAIRVVEKLHAAGFEAWWAGGCVRDQLLGREPKDFDVATNARPDQIRQLFGEKKTLAIGAAFGVITVLGPKSAGQIEVATFRRDGGYADGRHPDSVEFTNAREDALRRDFTINGMFFDPIANRVLDYVDGQQDLDRRLIRAIGNPHQRINEDKLRMLRGVRFAATFGFELESETLSAIQEHATEIRLVSSERIGAELVRMLGHGNKMPAAKLLLESKLMAAVLPEKWGASIRASLVAWDLRLAELKRLDSSEFEPVAFLLLRDFLEARTEEKKGSPNNASETNVELLSALSDLQGAWRLTNQQRDHLLWIAIHWQALSTADSRSWSEVQPLLLHPAARCTLSVARAIAGTTDGTMFCETRLRWPAEKLDPSPFLSGSDLIELGMRPGPQFKSLLQAVRDRQLEGEINSSAEAKQFVLNSLQ